MIKSFKHKGLERFFKHGITSGIDAQQATKIRLRLAALDAAESIGDMNRVGYNLHQLKGNKTGFWSITVTGNWRITFKFENGHAYIINYEDYH